MGDLRVEFPMMELLECRLAGIDVLALASFLERETSKVRFDVLNPSWIVFGDGFRDSPFQQLLGRAFDVTASTALLLPALPLMLLTALAIRIEDGWRAPVLYRQRRVGRYNQPFELLKFRSMQVNAEVDGAVWATPNDPRITRVGAFIRLSRIDELPQLINVLRNEMSFVGPRTERPEFVKTLAERLPYYRSRTIRASHQFLPRKTRIAYLAGGCCGRLAWPAPPRKSVTPPMPSRGPPGVQCTTGDA